MNEHARLYAIILVVVFCLCLASCKDAFNLEKEPELVDRSFVTGEPCKAPCWQGLKLDESTTDEAYSRLKELPFLDPGSVKTWNNVTLFGFSDATFIQYRCVETKSDVCGYLLFKNGLLKVSSHEIQYSLPIKTVVDMLGAPDHVISSPNWPEGCILDFEWPEKKISLPGELMVLLFGNVMTSKLAKPSIRIWRSRRYTMWFPRHFFQTVVKLVTAHPGQD